jgi:hypothetical protein
MWSAEETLVGDAPGLPIGMVYMFDPAKFSALPLKVSVSLLNVLYWCCVPDEVLFSTNYAN